MDHCWTLGDDLILCRLSSLLCTTGLDQKKCLDRIRIPTDKIARDPTNQEQQESDDDDEEEVSTCSFDDVDRADSSNDDDAFPFTLIPSDTAVVLPAILPDSAAQSGGSASMGGGGSGDSYRSNPVNSLLSCLGVEEVESLDPSNGGPTSGQCQFACIAMALSPDYGKSSPLRDGYRPDLELRKLALNVISLNPDLYRNFLTVAGGRTRAQNQGGGTSVDLAGYLRTMSSPSCDGDAVTLQALCDALKITVRIIKPVDANAYNELSQRRRLAAAASFSSSVTTSSFDEPDEGDTTVGDDSSSVSSSASAASVPAAVTTPTSKPDWPFAKNPYSGMSRIHRAEHRSRFTELRRNRAPKRLYVSHEIQPRPLNCVDSRIRDVQNSAASFGRLIWLSHIGGEVHYRLLRPATTLLNAASTSPFCPLNDGEAFIANRSRIQRLQRLHSSGALDDGYRTHQLSKLSLNSLMRNEFKDDCLCSSLGEKTKGKTKATKPRCGLCMHKFRQGGASSVVSPSSCNHEFCRTCLEIWADKVTTTCPVCSCQFSSVVDHPDGRQDAVVGSRPCSSSYRFERSDDDSSISSTETDGSVSEMDEVSSFPLPPSLPASLYSSSGIDNPYLLMERMVESMLLLVIKKRIPSFRKIELSQDFVEPLCRLATDADGSFLRELLESNILGILRLILTPSVHTTLIATVSLCGEGSSLPARETLYIPSDKVFNVVLQTLDIISERCSIGDLQDFLTSSMLERSLGICKLLLWFMSCQLGPEYTRGIGFIHSILSRWSKLVGMITIDPHPESYAGKENKSFTSIKGEDKCKVQKKDTSFSQRMDTFNRNQKKRKSEDETKIGSTKVRKAEPSKVDTLTMNKGIKLRKEIEELSCFSRAPGKRTVRPVACTNISREQWSLRTYAE